MYFLKNKLFLLFCFLYYFPNICLAEENKQNNDIQNNDVQNYDLDKLKELFESEEMKQILGNDNILEILGRKPLAKNYFYSTNIGLGLHNNFADIGHKLQNWHNTFFRFKKTKEKINDCLRKHCVGEEVLYLDFPKDYSGFYKYFNFIQSLMSNSFYINPSWNFQVKKSNFFAHVGLFFEKNTSKYSYNFILAEDRKKEKTKNEENGEEIKEEEIEKEANENKENEKEKEKMKKKNVSTSISFNSIKTGISFGFIWYSNKINPWAGWNVSCMFSLGLQFGYNDNFDFSFYKWGNFFEKKTYDFQEQNNPNIEYLKKTENFKLYPFYGLFQISAGLNKFSIWFRIYSSFIKKPSATINEKIYPENYNENFKSEYKDVDINLGKKEFPVILNNLNFAFGFSYSF